MTTIEIIGVIVILLLIAYTATIVLIAMSWFPDDKTLYRYLLALGSRIVYVNDTDFAITDGDNDCVAHIHRIYFVIFCKWYIPDIGPIPIWYRSHKFIRKLEKLKKKSSKQRKDEKYSGTFGLKISDEEN